ncbi:hypothetical protein LZC95_07900 [Pendulispora brunnea]|uniref:Uncharacterized protein n=1 Tax=Pendulispora brunnea TaxID=2905690 RepID=A0ABZ2KHG7_9BACT
MMGSWAGWRRLPDGRFGFVVWFHDGPCMPYLALDLTEAAAVEEEDIYLDTLLAEGLCRSGSAALQEAVARAASYIGKLPLDEPGFLTYVGAADLAKPMSRR